MRQDDSPPPTSLAEILVEAKLIRATQLEQIRRAAERSGSAIISILVDQKLIDADALHEALRERLDFEVFDATSTVDPDALREIPHDQASRFKLLPVHLDRTKSDDPVLTVAMADPLDGQAIAEIEFATGCRVQPLIGRSSEIHDAIRVHYRHVVTQVIPRQTTATAPRQKNRRPFGANIPETSLETHPVPRIQHSASAIQRVDALVALLVRKGLFTQEDYEEQLRAIVEPQEGHRRA